MENIIIKTPYNINFALLNFKLNYPKISKIISDNYFLEDYIMVINKDFFIKVPNVYRYKVRYINNRIVLNELSKKDYCINSDYKDKKISKVFNKDIIMIILESPHKDEYSYNPFKAKAPAQGTTGNAICKYFGYILEILIKSNGPYKINFNCSNCYELVIVNPIPYQTSMYYYFRHDSNYKLKDEYKKLRDQVWNLFWNINDVRGSFSKLLVQLKPKIIFNLCTNQLKNNIDSFIKNESLYKLNLYKAGHPSCWHYHDKNIINLNYRIKVYDYIKDRTIKI